MMVSGQRPRAVFSPCIHQPVPHFTDVRLKDDAEEGPGTNGVSRRLRCSRPAGSPAIVCNSSAPRPGRRKPACTRLNPSRSTRWISSDLGIIAQLLLFSIFLFNSGVQAVDPRQTTQRNGLLIDPSPAPLPGHQMEVRAAPSGNSTSSLTSPSSILPTFTVVSSGSPDTTLATGISTATAQTTSLPQVFDTNLGDNFTNSACPKFFSNLQSNSDFQACYPLSLLITESLGFFQAEKSFLSTTFVLDAACRVNFQQCNSLMSSLAGQMRGSDVCGGDLQAQNPLVQQTYTGLVSYPVLYQAGCLKDSQGSYCFANAATNTTTVADAYPYYLPLGTPLPGAVRPSCDSCLRNTMNIFAGAARNGTQPVSKTYVAAAQQIDISCGPNWIQESVKISAAPASLVEGFTALSGLIVLIFAIVL